ncbi:hypothetical protein [Brevundimonas sp.]|uniref:hypothetical protein n=1 Tax=Brevundimonas sp. TaxID=1871086 RepID=UPI00391A9F68
MTQTSAPAPDYRALLDQADTTAGQGQIREATSSPPRDGTRIGREWIERLEQHSALLGYGLADGDENAAISVIDTGLTESEFDRWVVSNGWTAPGYIRWSFVSAMTVPAVSEAARAAIRYWPASTVRTGVQLQALHGGRVELRDGCFFVGERGQAANKLAWFHAEVGLDIDEAGFLILRDRVDGATRARIGEEMSWAGPASAKIDDDARRALQEACGPGDVLVVGSPESSERFQMRVADVRNRGGPR